MIHLREIHIGTDEANQLGEAEARHALTFAFAFSLLTLAAGIVGIIGAVALAPNLTGLVFVLVFGLGGAVVMLLLLLGFRRGRQHRSDFVDAWVSRQEVETALRKLGLVVKPQSALSTAETAQTPFPVTHGSKPLARIADFDERDLESLCIAFSLGAKWSENALVDKPLPVTKEMLTRTRHEALMTLFVAAAIIGGRDGDKRLTGKLLIQNPDEMVRKLHALVPAPPPQA